ncbi:MAG: VOC family protein [Anaerolineae bacterium]|nr:VOC family protein [Anaerolineae bacterium]
MSIESKNAIVKTCGLHHVTIQTRDWAASLQLYREVLGMTVVAEFGSPERRMMLLDTGNGSHIELIAPTSASPAVGSPAANDPLVHFALVMPDVTAAINRVRQAGYEITMEPKSAQLGTIAATVAFFKGPNGEVIEFFQTR